MKLLQIIGGALWAKSFSQALPVIHVIPSLPYIKIFFSKNILIQELWFLQNNYSTIQRQRTKQSLQELWLLHHSKTENKTILIQELWLLHHSKTENKTILIQELWLLHHSKTENKTIQLFIIQNTGSIQSKFEIPENVF